MRGAGRVPLATTGAAHHPTASDVESDVERVCGIQSRLQLVEEAHKVCERGSGSASNAYCKDGPNGHGGRDSATRS